MWVSFAPSKLVTINLPPPPPISSLQDHLSPKSCTCREEELLSCGTLALGCHRSCLPPGPPRRALLSPQRVL